MQYVEIGAGNDHERRLYHDLSQATAFFPASISPANWAPASNEGHQTLAPCFVALTDEERMAAGRNTEAIATATAADGTQVYIYSNTAKEDVDQQKQSVSSCQALFLGEAKDMTVYCNDMKAKHPEILGFVDHWKPIERWYDSNDNTTKTTKHPTYGLYMPNPIPPEAQALVDQNKLGYYDGWNANGCKHFTREQEQDDCAGWAADGGCDSESGWNWGACPKACAAVGATPPLTLYDTNFAGNTGAEVQSAGPSYVGDYIYAKKHKWFMDWVNFHSLWAGVGVFDDQTRVATAFFVTKNMNPTARLYTITSFAFKSSPTGFFEVKKKLSSILVPQYQYGAEGYPTENYALYVVEMLALAALCLVTLKEVGDIVVVVFRVATGELDKKQIIVEFRLALIDWLMFGFGWALVGVRIATNKTASDIHNRYGGSGDLDLNQVITSFAEAQAEQAMYKGLEVLLLIILMTQLFRYFSFDPRMNVVVTTVSSASEKLLPVLLIFLVILVAYSLLGIILFGSELDAFSSFGNAYQACLLFTLGDYDFEAMRSVDKAGAGLFYWTFTILIVILVLNMVLGVVLGVYDEIAATIDADKGQVGFSQILVAAFFGTRASSEAKKFEDALAKRFSVSTEGATDAPVAVADLENSRRDMSGPSAEENSAST
jgi:hypothetical protein